MRRPRSAALVCLLVVVALGLTACSIGDRRPLTSPIVTEDFSTRVTVTDTGLRLDNQPWWPTGFNAYQLGTDWSINEGCGAEVDLDAYFAKLPAHALTRFNLFSMFVVDKNSGLIDFGPLDAVFDAATRHRQMVLPVLAGGTGQCEDDQFKQRSWYDAGWRTQKSLGGMTFADWVRAAVTRWKDRPTIAGWELVGEPEASVCGAQGCDWQVRECPPGGDEILRSFFDDAGGLLRSLDPNRPIFAGFVGGDQCGLEGSDYLQVAGSERLDVLDFHDYGGNLTDYGPSGSDLPTRIRQASEAGKPIMVNEIGVNAGSCLDPAERARGLRTKIGQQRDAGTAGALLWAFVPDPRTRECTYDIGPSDPAWQVIADTVS
ncbi:beta-mannosidase [Gordonia sp. Z-3]|uniref:Beta-mannosidase n=1 Tax=Gordonia tangerina TaxID=2911060 RepID=A0ABS9DJS1_9ACTN|nr:MULTISPECIES: beta-mannosidase [Gordonia]MCF3939411.1 beta-mannosidase [Gordonia tangerina]MED5802037.1 beta-mannosidase [Gordonia sp. Z-3]